jgi:DNA-binding PadR family transcriptional regulator
LLVRDRGPGAERAHRGKDLRARIAGWAVQAPTPTPGNLIIQLGKLEQAGYLSSEKTRNGSAQKTTVTLTRQGRAALGTYTQALRDLLGGL